MSNEPVSNLQVIHIFACMIAMILFVYFGFVGMKRFNNVKFWKRTMTSVCLLNALLVILYQVWI